VIEGILSKILMKKGVIPGAVFAIQKPAQLIHVNLSKEEGSQ
jgi:hypothetical protein